MAVHGGLADQPARCPFQADHAVDPSHLLVSPTIAIVGASNIGATNDLEDLVDDRSELTDLVARLGRCLDEKRYEQMPTVFAPDAEVNTPTGSAKGLDAVIEKARTNRPDGVSSQSFITNPLIEVNGDTATIEANLFAVFIGSNPRFFGERYHLTATRTPDGWRIIRVTGVPLWEGPLPALMPLR